MKPIIAELGAETGATMEAIKKWRQRGEVPHKHRLPILGLAAKRNLAVRESDFQFDSTGGSRSAPRRKSPKRRAA